jgi:hypothetical protein
MYRNVRTYKFLFRKVPIFENLYNAQAGIIIAKENSRFRDETEPGNQRLDWQKEAFLSYSEMADHQHVPVIKTLILYRKKFCVEIAGDVEMAGSVSPNRS